MLSPTTPRNVVGWATVTVVFATAVVTTMWALSGPPQQAAVDLTRPSSIAAAPSPRSDPATEYDPALDTGPDAALIPLGVTVVGGEAGVWIPHTWEQLAANTDGPAIVRITAYSRTEGAGTSRHQASAEEAAAINTTYPADSIKPRIRAGQWIGSVGIVSTYYRAEVTWLDASRTRETLELGFIGGLAGDLFLIVDELPLPRIGSEYLMFLTVGDGWVSAEFVQFAIRGGRLQPHMHNEGGLGSALVGKTPDDLAKEMPPFAFTHARQATRP